MCGGGEAGTHGVRFSTREEEEGGVAGRVFPLSAAQYEVLTTKD